MSRAVPSARAVRADDRTCAGKLRRPAVNLIVVLIMESTVRNRRQWRFYKTEAGGSPIDAFLDDLDEEEAVEVAAAMADVRKNGLPAAKHLRRDIYEVVADGPKRTFRILLATEGRYSHVLLAVVAFAKKTPKTPPRMLDLAETRLKDWRRRGELMRRDAEGAS